MFVKDTAIEGKYNLLYYLSTRIISMLRLNYQRLNHYLRERERE